MGKNEFPVVPAKVLSLTELGGGRGVIFNEKNVLQLMLKSNFDKKVRNLCSRD